jgi:hypothetical protein
MANARINVNTNTSSANNAINRMAQNAVAGNNRIAQSTQNIQGIFDRLNKSAEEVGRNIIRAFSTNAPRDMMKAIEETIRAMDRMNRMQAQAEKLELNNELAQGRISPDNHQKAADKQLANSREANLQVQLLRELINTIRNQGRQEIATDRSGVERTLSNNRMMELRGGDDELDFFKRVTQKDELGDGEDSPRGGGGERRRRAGEVTNNVLGNLAQKNEIYTMAALAGMIPVIGAGLSQFFSKAFGDADKFEQARAGVRGLGAGGYSPDGRGSQFGFSMSEFMNQYVQASIRNTGVFAGGADAGFSSMLLNRGAGVEQGVVGEMQKNLRTAGTQDILGLSGAFQKALENSGVVAKDDFSRLGEFLQINNQLLGDQLLRLNDINASTNQQLITGLSGLGGAFKDPRVVGGVINSMDESLRNAKNPYIEAVQYDVLARSNPKMNYFDFLERKSKGIQDQTYTEGMMDYIMKASGGNAQLGMTGVRNNFGLENKEGLARSIYNRYASGGSIYDAEGKLDSGFQAQMEGRAGQVSGNLMRKTAGMEDLFAGGGERVIAALDKAFEGMGGINAAVNGIFDLTSGSIGYIGEAVGLLKSIAEGIDRMSNLLSFGGDRPPKPTPVPPGSPEPVPAN